jgi:hypothetical protein
MAQAQVSNVILLTWISNTFARSSSKRAVAIGFINSIAMSGSILSPSVPFSYFLRVAFDDIQHQVHLGIELGPDV